MLGTVSTSDQGIPAEEKDYYLAKGYSLNDRVGLSYLEKEYEEYLHGEKAEYEIVNSHETKLIKEGKRGKDIVLTIDINLQREVERILSEQIRNAKGEANTDFYDHSSVVIQDPKTGEILAMASKKIVNGKIVDNTTSILISPITPGSVVKGASMLVGYNTGAIHIGETMLDECVKVKGVAKKCSSVDNLGVINDITALAKSSNVYQFKTAIRVNGQEYYYDMPLIFKQKSFDTYRNMYHSFGLGVKTEIDLPNESLGYKGKSRLSGLLLDFSIGQYDTYSALQLSSYVNTLANLGERNKLHIVKEVRYSTDDNSIGAIKSSVDKELLNTSDIDKIYFERVREGFVSVMEGYLGRGYMGNSPSPAGKTGTSESFYDSDGDGKVDEETYSKSFIGYAPYDNPVMSIVSISPHISHKKSTSSYTSNVNKRIVSRICNIFFENYK